MLTVTLCYFNIKSVQGLNSNLEHPTVNLEAIIINSIIIVINHVQLLIIHKYEEHAWLCQLHNYLFHLLILTNFMLSSCTPYF